MVQTSAKRSRQAAPEERLWLRYSPHHELPVSGASSLFVHLLLFGLLLLGGFVAARMSSTRGAGPAVGVVALEGESTASRRNADAGSTSRDELRPPAPTPEISRSRKTPDESVLKKVKEKPVDLFQPEDVSPDELAPNDAAGQIHELARKKLDEAKKSTGNKGPAGTPEGSEIGSKETPRAKLETVRQKRMLRWTMVFRTRNGRDYLQQLKALGAVLAYETADGSTWVIHDTSKRPAEAQAEALNFDRIHWIDDRPESVQSLARALGIAAPKKFIAFFPDKFEKVLVRKELAYAGRKEEEIHETRFKIVTTPRGFEPEVVNQTPAQ